MKLSLQLFAVVGALMVGCVGSQTVHAQAASSSSDAQPLSFQDKMKLMKARNQVFQSNPDLKTEGDDLKKQGQALKDGSATPEQKLAFAKNLKEHQEKMKAALLQVDPTLGPLIDQADAEMKQKMMQHAAGN